MDRLFNRNRYDIVSEEQSHMGGGRRGKQNRNKQSAKQLSRGHRGYYRQQHYHEDDTGGLDDSGSSHTKAGCFPSLLKRGGAGGRMSGLVNKLVPMKNRGDNHRSMKRPQWNKIKIPKGALVDTDFILDSLQGYVDAGVPFHPINPRKVDDDFVFYLDNEEVAAAVQSADSRIQLAPGSKIRKLYIKNYKAPAMLQPISQEEFEVVKSVLGKRYNAQTKHLDLRDFEEDAEFRENSMMASLARPPYMWACTQIVGENIPDLLSLDLSKNRLKFLDWPSNLACRTKNLKRLDLSSNLLSNVRELEKCRGWTQLVELDLEHNPLMENIPNEAAYISGVHRVFPKVTKLDKVDIPASEINFGIDEDTKATGSGITMPPFKAGFYLNDSLRKILETFVLEYFKLYDGHDSVKSRQALFQAYDADATFTMVLENLDRRARYENTDLYTEYRRKSHNIMNQELWQKFRHNLVSNGNLEIVSVLTKLPKTQHIMQSFVLDVQFATDTLMCFTVSGLFKDGDLIENDDPTFARYFSKSLVVKSMGGGTLAIVNDMLLISALTPNQVEAYSRLLSKSLQAAAPVEMTAGASTTMAPTLNRESLVAQFSAQTNMKADWATKCLEDNSWDLQSAINVFSQLKGNNVIPPEAFL